MGECSFREAVRARPPPMEYDAELTIEKPFAFWIIDDSSTSVERPSYEDMISVEKTRSQSFKHPFILAVTLPSEISALLDFLLDQATKTGSS
jgi:hypothetical protein